MKSSGLLSGHNLKSRLSGHAIYNNGYHRDHKTILQFIAAKSTVTDHRLPNLAARGGFKTQALRQHPLSEALRSLSPTDDIIRRGSLAAVRSKLQAGDGFRSCRPGGSEKGRVRSVPKTRSPVFQHLHGSIVRERRRPPTNHGFRLAGEHVVGLTPTRLNV